MVITTALTIDLISGLICVAAFLFASLQQYLLYRKYPFQGLKFFSWGFLMQTLPIQTVVLILALRIFDLAESLHEILVFFYMITYSIGAIGLATFAIGLLVIHPRSPEKNWSITQLLIGGIAGFATGTILTTLEFDWFTEEASLINPVTSSDFRYGDIYIYYPLLLVITLLLLVALLVVIALRHVRKLREIQRLQTHPTPFSTRWTPIAYICCLIAFLILLFSRLPGFEQYSLALTFSLPLSIGGFAFSMAFRRNPSLLAITKARLSSLIIINPDGLTVYAYDFKTKNPNYDNLSVLLGGMLSALNISLSETLESQSGLSSIAFGDKIIMIHSTPKFVLYLITSEINPTISDLIKLYVKRFEEGFGDLLGTSDVVEGEKYLSFSETVEDLIQFAPLSQ
jgi:hypothetical protein